MSLIIYQPAPVPRDEPRREQAVEQSGALDAHEDPVLQAIVNEARRTLGTRMAAVSIIHSDWQYLIAATGLPTGAYSRRTSFCGHAIVTGEPVFCVMDACANPRFAGNPVVAEEGLVRFYVGVPLLNDERLPLGTLCVFDPDPRERLPATSITVLVELARRVIARLRQLQPGEAA